MITSLLQIPHKFCDAKLTELTLLFNNQIHTLQIKADISTIIDTSLQKYFSNLRPHFENFYTAIIPSFKRLNHAR